MIIVDKQTLETHEQHEVARMFPHAMFDFTDPEIVGEVLDGLGLAVLIMPDQPMHDSRYQVVTVGSVTEDDGKYSGDWVLSFIDLTQEQRRDLISDKRWAEETKPVEYAGRQFHADRDSRVMLLSMSIDAKLDPEYNEPEFKTMDGFVPLSNADILAVGQMVKAQVRAVYARESHLLAMIDSGDEITPDDW